MSTDIGHRSYIQKTHSTKLRSATGYASGEAVTNVTLTEILYRVVNTSCMMSCVRLGTSKRVSAPRAARARACVSALSLGLATEKKMGRTATGFFSVFT